MAGSIRHWGKFAPHPAAGPASGSPRPLPRRPSPRSPRDWSPCEDASGPPFATRLALAPAFGFASPGRPRAHRTRDAAADHESKPAVEIAIEVHARVLAQRAEWTVEDIGRRRPQLHRRETNSRASAPIAVV